MTILKGIYGCCCLYNIDKSSCVKKKGLKLKFKPCQLSDFCTPGRPSREAVKRVWGADGVSDTVQPPNNTFPYLIPSY